MKLRDFTKDKLAQSDKEDTRTNKSSAVLKHQALNRSAKHVDKKKRKKLNPRKAAKHKGRMYEQDESVDKELIS